MSDIIKRYRQVLNDVGTRIGKVSPTFVPLKQDASEEELKQRLEKLNFSITSFSGCINQLSLAKQPGVVMGDHKKLVHQLGEYVLATRQQAQAITVNPPEINQDMLKEGFEKQEEADKQIIQICDRIGKILNQVN